MCEEREIGTARVFGVEFNFTFVLFRIFHGLYTLLEYLLACAAELVLDVQASDEPMPGMNSFAFRIMYRLLSCKRDVDQLSQSALIYARVKSRV